jgi:hypothetical protein
VIHSLDRASTLLKEDQLFQQRVEKLRGILEMMK